MLAFRTATPGIGNIRNASLLDASELSRLIATSPHHVPGDSLGWFDRGHLLVLDLCDGTLGAAVHVDVRNGHAMMDLLVVDPRFAGRDLERRMSGVAHALCEAYGCDHIETRSEPRLAGAARGRR